MPGKGIRDLAIISPSFVSDCLETLEEIDIRARESFMASGGNSFCYIPCVNSDPDWAAAIGRWMS